MRRNLNIIRTPGFIRSLFFALAVSISCGTVHAEDLAARISAKAAAGVLVPRITDVEEFKALFGAPVSISSRPSGGAALSELIYPDNIHVTFRQMSEDIPFTLLALKIKGRRLNLGKTVLRNTGDLRKLDRFIGLEGVSLAKLDLRKAKDAITRLPFDSLTLWPPKNKLPPGFDPEAILEKGKDPGLGIRRLHEDGVDGRGVGIAVVDQPLLLGHYEYTSRLVYYSALGLSDADPQTHGPAVASFAVGKDIGTAPGAALYYFATPSWIPDNLYRTEALRTIIELNKSPVIKEKIRVVSISHGEFRTQENYGKWQEVLSQAEAAGIMVITCDSTTIDFGTLARDVNGDVDLPASYTPEKWDTTPHPVWVPGGSRSYASIKGETEYTFETASGQSWSTPYLAGVAALGFQVNPELTPVRIKELLIKSASPTKSGPILNPQKFVELAREATKPG